MNIREYFKNLIKQYTEERAALFAEIVNCEDAEQRAAISGAITKLDGKITEAETQLANLPAEDDGNEGNNGGDNGTEGRNFNPLAAMGLNTVGQTLNGQNGESRDADPYATMEYRTAFMNYVRTGEQAQALTVEKRADDPTELSKLGVLIPSTVVNEIIKGVEKVRGQLYGKVKKTNLRGGVKYPIGAFSATFNRIGEKSAPTDRQNGGSGITGHVEFGYLIGEIRLAQTLLMTVMGVEVFEKELAKILVEAYVEAMDKEILNGDPAKNQMCGILTNDAAGLQRIPAENIIEFTAGDVADWTKWEEKLFAEIPLSMEGASPEFVMAKQTYVSNLCTLKDLNGQPINKAGYDVTDRMHKFNEYPVTRVEKDVFKDFNSCADGEYFGMFWVGEKAYAINSNLQFAVSRYYDNEKHEYVQNGLVINDGKILDPKYIYLLKKKVATV